MASEPAKSQPGSGPERLIDLVRPDPGVALLPSPTAWLLAFGILCLFPLAARVVSALQAGSALQVRRVQVSLAVLGAVTLACGLGTRAHGRGLRRLSLLIGALAFSGMAVGSLATVVLAIAEESGRGSLSFDAGGLLVTVLWIAGAGLGCWVTWRAWAVDEAQEKGRARRT